MKTLLILSGGEEAVEGIKTAKKMGVNAIICDGNPDAPGREYADDFILASVYHPKKIIEKLRDYPDKSKIDGVITIAADNSIAVAEVAAYLGLKSISVKTAEIATNKLLMKQMLEKEGINIPWYKAISSLEELEKVMRDTNGDYVLKPVDSRGSRGVIRLNNNSNFKEAFEYSIEYSESRQLILEEWIEGFQLSSESIVWEGESYLCGLADRNYQRLKEIYPHVVEDGGETPSRFSSKNLENDINVLMTNIAKLIGLSDGSLKGDLVLTDKGLYIIEFATRLSGGFFSTYTIPLVYNVNLIGNVIKMALGEAPEIPSSPLKVYKYQANRFCFVPQGVVKSVSGVPDENEKLKVVKIYVKKGDVLPKITNHTLRAGTVLAVADTREKAIEEAEKAIASINIEVI